MRATACLRRRLVAGIAGRNGASSARRVSGTLRLNFLSMSQASRGSDAPVATMTVLQLLSPIDRRQTLKNEYAIDCNEIKPI